MSRGFYQVLSWNQCQPLNFPQLSEFGCFLLTCDNEDDHAVDENE